MTKTRFLTGSLSLAGLIAFLFACQPLRPDQMRALEKMGSGGNDSNLRGSSTSQEDSQIPDTTILSISFESRAPDEIQFSLQFQSKDSILISLVEYHSLNQAKAFLLTEKIDSNLFHYLENLLNGKSEVNGEECSSARADIITFHYPKGKSVQLLCPKINDTQFPSMNLLANVMQFIENQQ